MQIERSSSIVRYDLDSRRAVSADMELSELMARWLRYKKGFVKESTYANFVLHAENHINPFFEGRVIGSITEGDLQDFIVHLYTEGRMNRRGGFGVRSIRGIMLPLKLALEYAWKYNRSIDKLEWELLEYPKENQADQVRSMTYEQQQAFVKSVYQELNRKTAGYLLTLFTGMRIGEVCGLQVCDISIALRKIYVKQTVQRIYDKEDGTRIIIGTPKTEHSLRTIPFPELLVPVLSAYCKDTDGYFLTGNQKPCEPRVLRQCFCRFLKRHNLPPMKYHELRHTFAARAVEIPEFDIKSLSAILGHNNPAFTLAVYGRANMEQEEHCMQLMNRILQDGAPCRLEEENDGYSAS